MAFSDPPVEGSVSDIVIFYLDDFVGLITPLWVILLPLRVVVRFFSKTLTISFTFTSGYLRVFCSLFVKLTLTSKWFLSSWASLGFIFVDEWTVSLYLSNAWDNIRVQLPRLNLTLSCIIFFIVLMKRSTASACVRVTTWVMPFFLKNVFYFRLEGTGIITINRHRKTHCLETFFHFRQSDWSKFFFHRDDISQLAEDVNDHQPVSRLTVLDGNFRLWFFGKGFHIHYVNLIFKPCEGGGVWVWPPDFQICLLGCFLIKFSTSTLLMVWSYSFAFLRVSLIEPKPVSRL